MSKAFYPRQFCSAVTSKLLLAYCQATHDHHAYPWFQLR